jgi:hypothetical protein
LADCAWVEPLISWEEAERARRSLERRLASAHIGRFKPLADFDWDWPEQCDRAAISELMSLEFLKSATNAILVGSSGLGKSTLAQNIAHQAVLHGHTVLFTTAGQLLGDLAALDSDSALRRRLRHYAAPSLLVIDEVGYLSYSNRHADLLFELINRRHESRSTLDHHQPLVLGVGGGLSQRRLCRRPHRSSRPSRRDHRHQGRILSPQGGAASVPSSAPENVESKAGSFRMKPYHQPSGLTHGLDFLIARLDTGAGFGRRRTARRLA